MWKFRLFVGGRADGRVLEEKLRHLCDESIPGSYRIEVIDLNKNPELARRDQIMALPTLIRSEPSPKRRVIGDINNLEIARAALDLPPAKKLHPTRTE